MNHIETVNASLEMTDEQLVTTSIVKDHKLNTVTIILAHIDERGNRTAIRPCNMDEFRNYVEHLQELLDAVSHF